VSFRCSPRVRELFSHRYQRLHETLLLLARAVDQEDWLVFPELAQTAIRIAESSGPLPFCRCADCDCTLIHEAYVFDDELGRGLSGCAPESYVAARCSGRPYCCDCARQRWGYDAQENPYVVRAP
jgi:hypothetical protein